MPTQRKRIGFLPRTEVQNIIDKISKYNRLSQSKVTGILVEEALYSRGVLNSEIDNIAFDNKESDASYLIMTNDKIEDESHKLDDDHNLDKSYLKDEVQRINEFIEFKFFKKIMNKNEKKYGI